MAKGRSVIDNIRMMQEAMPDLPGMKVPPHNPEMLLIGCVDARLNISSDIGIEQGKALIKRNVAALVPPRGNGGLAVGAALEFAVSKMKVKDIAVMGHTYCGGIAACLDHAHNPEGQDQNSDIVAYLKPLNKRRAEIIKEGGDMERQARAMEREAVRMCIDNLMTYPVVAKAVKEGAVKLHGWVIDTATKKLEVLDQETGKFAPMVDKKKDKPGSSLDGTTQHSQNGGEERELQ